MRVVRSTADISLGMFLLMVSGLVLWLAYGIILADLPLIASNTMTLLFAGMILYFKVRHG